jgi:hypothetical protein
MELEWWLTRGGHQLICQQMQRADSIVKRSCCQSLLTLLLLLVLRVLATLLQAADRYAWSLRQAPGCVCPRADWTDPAVHPLQGPARQRGECGRIEAGGGGHAQGKQGIEGVEGKGATASVQAWVMDSSLMSCAWTVSFELTFPAAVRFRCQRARQGQLHQLMCHVSSVA